MKNTKIQMVTYDDLFRRGDDEDSSYIGKVFLVALLIMGATILLCLVFAPHLLVW